MGKKAEQSRIAYNNMAPEYNASPEGGYTRPHKAELIRRVALRDGDAVLDVACGNGALLAALSQKARVSTFGVDISENMIAEAKRGHPGGTFAVGPCAPLDLADGSMDVITVSCAFHHFEEPLLFAEECMRVLKPDGTLYMAEPYFSPVVRWAANALVFPLAKTGDVKVYSAGELRAIFEAAGFIGVETDIKATVLFFSAKKRTQHIL